MESQNKKIKLITHSAGFHADDVFATAALLLLIERDDGAEYEVIRTRDEEVIATGDYVYDVGGVYDPVRKHFDHHQQGAGTHGNGIPYAAFGLVWKEYGEKLTRSKDAADAIERKLVMPIDADDNAALVYEPKFENIFEYSIANVVSSFIPSLKHRSDENLYAAFMRAVALAKEILKNEIEKAVEKYSYKDEVISIYKNAPDKRVIVMQNYYPWKEFLSPYPEPLFVITPREDNMYQVYTMPEGNPRFFKNRKDLPKAWAGLRSEELAKVTGVPDAVFCHKSLFLAVAKSKEGAIALANIALKS